MAFRAGLLPLSYFSSVPAVASPPRGIITSWGAGGHPRAAMTSDSDSPDDLSRSRAASVQVFMKGRIFAIRGFGHKARFSRALGSNKGRATIEESPNKFAASSTKMLVLTYLEGNSWLWEVMGISILVDPILEGNLDFGLPWLYSGAKRELLKYKVENLPKVDHLLITQGLDDHCHKRTLEKLATLHPELHVIATPNAEHILKKLFPRVTYLEPGETTVLKSESGSEVIVRASAGPVLGPPWQRPENGYLVEAQEPKFSLYYEPHCVFDKGFVAKQKADVVVTPVIKQVLPSFTLVSGQEDAVQLAELLQPKFIVTMDNGNLESTGLLSSILSQVGTVALFKHMLEKAVPNATILEPKPGVPLEVPLLS